MRHRPSLGGGFRRKFRVPMSSAGLIAELERLANAISTQKPGEQEISLPAVAERISKVLGVKPDEVAILAVSQKWKHLHFLVPQALKNVGFIPLSSPSALAARTARENRTEVDNKFHETRHASVFEAVKNETLTAEAIQKIVSAPIAVDNKVIGVLQVSRKGSGLASAGPDFASDDVIKITSLCKPLGKLIQHLTGE